VYENDGSYYSLVVNKDLSVSLFTKLFFMNGKYTNHFEKVSDEQIKELLLKNRCSGYCPFESPVGVYFTREGKKVVTCESEDFDSFDKLIERLLEKDHFVYKIIQNLNSGKFKLRMFKIPENFDLEFHTFSSRIYSEIYKSCKQLNKKMDELLIYELIENIYDIVSQMSELSLTDLNNQKISDYIKMFSPTHK
jgi:Mg2+ and Co2+ transporter CorA